MNPTPGMIAAAEYLSFAISENLNNVWRKTDSNRRVEVGEWVNVLIAKMSAEIGPEIEARDKRIAELEREVEYERLKGDATQRDLAIVNQSLLEQKRLTEQLKHTEGVLKSTANAFNGTLIGKYFYLEEYVHDPSKISDMVRSVQQQLAAVTAERDKAVKAMSDWAAKCGETEGKLMAIEMYGVVQGWKERAEKAESQYRQLIQDQCNDEAEIEKLIGRPLHDGYSAIPVIEVIREQMQRVEKAEAELLTVKAEAAAMRESEAKP